MSIFIDADALQSAVRLIQNGEPASGEVLNRPTVDLIAALAGNGGVFSQMEELTNFANIHKASHVTNDTKLLLHFDSGLTSAIDGKVPDSIDTGMGLVADTLYSKYYSSYDFG